MPAQVRTNPKTVLFCPDALDDIDAVNLWTRIYDQEHDRACAQLGIRDEGPAVTMLGANEWEPISASIPPTNRCVDVAAEFGIEDRLHRCGIRERAGV